MNEFMGLVYGVYDAKKKVLYRAVAVCTKSCMSGHGPDNGATYTKRPVADLKPHYIDSTLAFMFGACALPLNRRNMP